MSIISERRKINRLIRKSKTIFLMAHKNLDLDALGSSIGMLKYLQKRRKQVYEFNFINKSLPVEANGKTLESDKSTSESWFCHLLTL